MQVLQEWMFTIFHDVYVCNCLLARVMHNILEYYNNDKKTNVDHNSIYSLQNCLHVLHVHALWKLERYVCDSNSSKWPYVSQNRLLWFYPMK